MATKEGLEMNKHFRIIDVNGFRGLLLFLFILVCLATGFIAFPAYLAMNLWNVLAPMIALPTLSDYANEVLTIPVWPPKD